MRPRVIVLWMNCTQSSTPNSRGVKEGKSELYSSDGSTPNDDGVEKSVIQRVERRDFVGMRSSDDGGHNTTIPSRWRCQPLEHRFMGTEPRFVPQQRNPARTSIRN